MDTFLYFAYGSNMLTERLQVRCPSARPIGNAIAPNLYICFKKLSNDESGKATLIKDKVFAREAYGVLFTINESERKCLDDAEGKGYCRDDEFKVVRLGSNEEIITSAYLALSTTLTDGLSPYTWYSALIVAGATQHKLADVYTKELCSVPMKPDENLERKTRKDALDILKQAGYTTIYEGMEERLRKHNQEK